MEILTFFADLILHVDVYIDVAIEAYGAWVYLILFLVIFCETGLIVTPMLPGDSLLFAAGVAAAAGGLNIYFLTGLLFAAAVLGDLVNYSVGRFFGERILIRYPKVVRPSHIEKTRQFFERFGGRAIIFARFIPIVRTIAPFLAGTGQMTYGRFVRYNIAGALLWVGVVVPAGYFLGSLPFVEDNLSLILLLVIVVSFLPPIVEWLRTRRAVALPTNGVDRTP